MFPPKMVESFCFKPGKVMKARTQQNTSFVRVSPWGSPPTDWMPTALQLPDFSRISLHERKKERLSLSLSLSSLSFIRLNIPRNIYLPAGYIAFFAHSPSLMETHGHACFIRGVVITGRRDSVLLALLCHPPSPQISAHF